MSTTTELQLEQELFGKNVQLVNDSDNIRDIPDDQLFTLDSQPNETKPLWQDDDEDVSLTAQNRTKKLRLDVDEDEIEVQEYEKRLRSQFESIYQRPKWADFQEEVSLLGNTKGILSSSRYLNPSHKLQVVRVKDANFQKTASGIITSVSWHPVPSVTSDPIICASSMDKSLKIYKIGTQMHHDYGHQDLEQENEIVSELFFKELGGIRKAQFTSTGQEIIVAGRRKFFYAVDVTTGAVKKIPGIQSRSEKSFEKFQVDDKYLVFSGDGGQMVMCDAKSKMFVRALTVPTGAAIKDFAIYQDLLYSLGSDSEVCIWDIRNTNRCLTRFKNEGSVNPYSITVSEQSVCIGDDMGVVNVYDHQQVSKKGRLGVLQPQKTLMNLTTAISTLTVNPQDQLMVMASHVKKDQLRIVNLNGLDPKVYTNWPTSATPLGYVQCGEFSPSSGHLALGNDKGKVLLFRLPHYPQK